MNPAQKPVLSIETATPVCSVALRLPDGSVLEERAEGKGVHSELTFVYIRKLLDDTGIGVSDLGAVLVSGGPGSYTGLRVGGSAVKGLLFQSGVPLFAYNTLAGIALGAVRSDEAGGDSGAETSIEAVIDARRNHLYHQTWRYDDNGLTPQSELVTIELDVVLEWWMSGRMLAGTGSERLIRLAESRGLDPAGFPHFSGTGRISAASMLIYTAGDPEGQWDASQRYIQPAKGRGMVLIRKVDPAGYEPDYYSGM